MGPSYRYTSALDNHLPGIYYYNLQLPLNCVTHVKLFRGPPTPAHSAFPSVFPHDFTYF